MIIYIKCIFRRLSVYKNLVKFELFVVALYELEMTKKSLLYTGRD